MVYTVFSLTEFYAENCKIRAKKRLQGTFIGVAIVVVLFIFIKNTAIRGIILLIAGYLNSFAEDYRDTTILVTISAVASVALAEGSLYAAINRIAYVIIGTILALMANAVIINKSKKAI